MADDPFLYPTWDVQLGNDKEIWDRLKDEVAKKKGRNEVVAKKLITDFLEHEQAKDNFISRNMYIERGQNDRIKIDVSVAPFIIPKPEYDDFKVKKEKYYNFHVRGIRYNGKVKRVIGGDAIFDKNSITKFISTGTYQSKVNGCPVLKERDTGDQIPFTFDGNNDLIVPTKDVDIVQYEVLRPYFKFLSFVEEAFALDPSRCATEDRMLLIMEHLSRLFVDSKIDISGHPWRRVQLKSNKADTVPYKTLEEQKEEDEEEQRKRKREEQYDLLKIDQLRLELDEELWANPQFRDQRRIMRPSVYDLFEVLNIDRTLSLPVALDALFTKLNRRRRQPNKYDWEPSHFKLYYDTSVDKKVVWESALVNCLHSEDKNAYQRAIVEHIFLNPSLQQDNTAYDQSKLVQQLSELKSKAFESFDNELVQNFATHVRAGSDSNKYLLILNNPWPKTKRLLRKQSERNRYYPEAFVSARFPSIFYPKLDQEHEACNRLRYVRRSLALSREIGKPVISRPRVKAPDAFHTDFRSMPLPRVLSRNPNDEFWSGDDPRFVDEYAREATRSGDMPRVNVKPITTHPLYPSRKKKTFGSNP